VLSFATGALAFDAPQTYAKGSLLLSPEVSYGNQFNLEGHHEFSSAQYVNGGVRRYRACRADKDAVRRARRPKPAKLASCERLRAMVEAKLLRAVQRAELQRRSARVQDLR
jgi:hypothetical protein